MTTIQERWSLVIVTLIIMIFLVVIGLVVFEMAD